MSALPIARLFGFEVRVHVSWAIILAVITVSVVAQLTTVAPWTEPAERWIVGAGISIAFLLSAVAHELGHAIVARRAGLPGGPVTVYFIGGAASPVLGSGAPRDEIRIALAGPAINLGIGALSVLIAAVIGGIGVGGIGGSVVGRGPFQLVAEAALVIGVLNLILGGVNLLPAYPFDGGRVARGAAWARTGDPARGLRVAARIGRWLGIGFAVAGLLLILVTDPGDGLMLALCGWFLVSSSRAVERTAEVDRLMDGIRVGDIMDRDVTRVPVGLTLDTFAGQILADASASVPVVRGADVVGMLGTRQVRKVRRDRWAKTRAGDLMAASDTLPTIVPETTVRAALEHLQASGLDGLPVTERGAFAGVVTRRAVAAAIRAKAVDPATLS